MVSGGTACLQEPGRTGTDTGTGTGTHGSDDAQGDTPGTEAGGGQRSRPGEGRNESPAVAETIAHADKHHAAAIIVSS